MGGQETATLRYKVALANAISQRVRSGVISSATLKIYTREDPHDLRQELRRDTLVLQIDGNFREKHLSGKSYVMSFSRTLHIIVLCSVGIAKEEIV